MIFMKIIVEKITLFVIIGKNYDFNYLNMIKFIKKDR